MDAGEISRALRLVHSHGIASVDAGAFNGLASLTHLPVPMHNASPSVAVALLLFVNRGMSFGGERDEERAASRHTSRHLNNSVC